MFVCPTREGMKLFETKDDFENWYEQGTNRWKILGEGLEEIEPIIVDPLVDPELEPIRLKFTVYAGNDADGNFLMSEDEDDLEEVIDQYTITYEG